MLEEQEFKKQKRDSKDLLKAPAPKIPEIPRGVLINGGSMEQRETLRKALLQSQSSLFSIISNQEKTSIIVFFLDEAESVTGLTFEQAEQLISKNNFNLSSGSTISAIQREFAKKRSGVVDLGPIPDYERNLIPEYIIDSSKQELIEQTIQGLIQKLFVHAQFTLEKRSQGYELTYTGSAKSMDQDTDKLISFGARLSASRTPKSFYINEPNIDLLNKLAKNIIGGEDLIKPLQIKSKWWRSPSEDKPAAAKPIEKDFESYAYAVSGSSYTPAMYASSPEAESKTPELVLPEREEINAVLGGMVTGVVKGIFSDEAMIIDFDRKLKPEAINQKLNEVLLKGIEGVQASGSSYSIDLVVPKKDYAKFMENLKQALENRQQVDVSL